MKWNWGKGIIVGMAAFMCFILYMVITMSTNKAYNHDLVTEDYYAKEMAYQKEIDAETNTHNLSTPITGSKNNEGWLLSFPNELDPLKTKGKVFLYRPSNQKLDFEFPLSITNNKLLIPDNQLIGGRWNIIIEFEQDNMKYMYKKSIVY